MTALAVASPAAAGDCCIDCEPPLQVPSTWIEACANICQDIDTSSDIDWECDTTRNGDGNVVNAVVIYDGTGSVCSKEYCAWGTAADGNAFRCSIDGDEGGENLTDISLLGGSEDDFLFFAYDDGTNGNLGDDLVCGEAGLDTISGDAGDDVLCGGTEDDDLSGGAGSDHLDYEGGSSDTNDGGDQYDYCNSVLDPNCEASLLSSPASCP